MITDHGKIMLTELYYLHVSLSIKCTGTSPTRLVIGLICYRHSKPENLEDDCPITMFSGNKRFSSFFANRPIKIIHKFEGCFLRGRVRSNGYKVFNGCIVEYLNFMGPFAKKLEYLLSSENVVIGQSSSTFPVRVKLFLSTCPSDKHYNKFGCPKPRFLVKKSLA